MKKPKSNIFVNLKNHFPKEYIENVSFQKGETGLSSLFFLQNDEKVREVACNTDKKNIKTFPRENLEVLLQACETQKKSILTNHISLENYEYSVSVLLEMPETTKNSQIEFLQLRLSLVDLHGEVRTHFTSGIHITKGHELMRSFKQLISQSVETVYFTSEVPIIDNKQEDLLSLKLEILEKDLTPLECSVILQASLSGYKYYMTNYFWFIAYPLSLIVFFSSFVFLIVMAYLLGFLSGSKKKTE